MKKNLILFFVFLLVIISLPAFAEEENWQLKPDEELSKDQAVLRIQEFDLTVKDLKSKLITLDADIERLKKELDETNQKAN